MTAAVGVVSKAAGAAAKGAKGATSAAAKGAKGASTAATRGAGAGTSTGVPAGTRGPAGKRTPSGDRQRADVQAIKDARPAEPDTAEQVTEQAARTGPVSQAAGVRPPAEAVKAANAGGGFLLGVGAWVLARTYLDGGAPAVKRLLRAKFFNEVTP